MPSSRIKRLVPILGVLVVVVSIGLVLGPASGPSTHAVPISKMRMAQIVGASETYHIVYGAWPTNILVLYADHNSKHLAFLADVKVTNDSWGHPLIYTPFDGALGYGTILSLGRDGKHGGEGPDQDLEEKFK